MMVPTKDPPLISVLTPIYMERENVAILIESLDKSLSGQPFEVIVIDDNSPDGTSDEVRKLSKKYDNIKLLVRPEKMGLGSAYRDGLKASSGSFIVEMDADLSHNPEDIPRLIKGLNPADIAIGSRYVSGGNIVGWGWHRRLISWGANRLARLVVGLKVKDVTSGFRIYRREAFEEIARHSRLNGYSFQVEALHIANKLGFTVEEVPITFIDRERGESKLGNKEIARFAWSIFSMRFLQTKGSEEV